MANNMSDLMVNITSKPNVKNEAILHGAFPHIAVATCKSLVADIAGEIYPLVRLPASARIIFMSYSNTADAGWTDNNVGVFPKTDWTLVDGVAVSANCLLDSEDMHLDSAVQKEVSGKGAGSYTSDLQASPLWKQAGVAAEPTGGTEYDICLTSDVQPAGGGTMVWTFIYLSQRSY